MLDSTLVIRTRRQRPFESRGWRCATRICSVVESIEFDTVRETLSNEKVEPWEVVYEAKWERYARELTPLGIPAPRLSRFLEKVCAPPCHPSGEPVDGWKHILPCLVEPEHWELPVACWNETEKWLRSGRPSLLRGLALLAQEAATSIPDWLRLSPHNFCRTARRLGEMESGRATALLARAHRHPVWGPAEELADALKRWAPLRVSEWMTEGDPEALPDEFSKRRPLLQLDLIYRLLRS